LKPSDKVSHRARIERGPQKHVLEYNEEKNSFVQCSLAAQQACDAKAVEESKKEAARAERAKKARFDRIVTVLDLSLVEYREMRKNNFFSMAKNTEGHSFDRKEQELIFKEIYAKMAKDNVCPQNTIDFAYLEKYTYFEEAIWITEKLGLHPLMKINENYNIVIVH
jgi:hypothetical protein